MRIAAALVVLLATPALAASEEFVVESAHTYPSFEVSHLGISTQRGRFEHTSGRILLDREAGTGTIEVVIDTPTISTGNRVLDAMLKGEDFFNVERFPAMTFRARSMEFEGGEPKRATGELTLLGVTRPVEMSFVGFACTRLPFLVRLTCGADVVAKIKRSDFGMTAYSAFVGDEVRLEIQVEAVKQEADAQPPPAGE
ncbi:MAG TPA: YceI family protein [Usitatibacteraceae bacterium]|nr:YceI family protein [Usitatibacteraceae bacterium]